MNAGQGISAIVSPPRRTVVAVALSALFGFVFGGLFLPPAQAGASPPAPGTKGAPPWDAAIRDPAPAKIYEAVAQRLEGKRGETPKAIASDQHVAVRLRELHRTDPTNAVPLYLLAFVAARDDDGKATARLLREGNAAPRVVYPISADPLAREYRLSAVFRRLANGIATTPPDGSLTEAEIRALLADVRTLGNRLAREAEPHSPNLVVTGASVRTSAAHGLTALEERAGRVAEAAKARAAEDKIRTWKDETIGQFKADISPGGPEAADTIAAPFGITREDLTDHLENRLLTSDRARQQFPAFLAELARRERRLADHYLKTMPD